MADETPFQAWADEKLLARMDKQLARYGWTRKELLRRMLLDTLPRLEKSEPPLIPEAEAAAE